jgi:hypothetical protein
MLRFLSLLPVGFALSTLFASSADAQFSELARRVPRSANAIAFVNVDKLMSSPVALREGWKDHRDVAFASNVSFLPPDTNHAVLAMQLDLHLWLPLWEVALLDMDHEPIPARVAEMTGGSVDSVSGRDVVVLPEDAYAVKFGSRTAGFMAPANRQSVARWLREIDARDKYDLSAYLSEAYSYANDLGTPLILALDLEDALPLEAIRNRFEDSREILDQHKLDVEPTAKMLAGLRGITLGVTFGDKPFGKLKVDFDQPVTLSPETAKALVLYALGNHGAMIEEFADWKPEVEGRQVTLEGYLERSGMKRISSLFNRPPSLKVREQTAEQQAKTPEELTREASVAYFHHITGLLEDLQGRKRTESNATIPQIGVWLDKYARKIDQLSILNVDPDLVQYGAGVSDSLRAAYNAIRMGSARARVRQANTPMQHDYYSAGTTYGYTYRDTYLGAGYVPYGESATFAVPDQRAYYQERTRIRTQERVSSANDARTIVQGIEAATADIRRAMTQKYQVEF